MTRNRSSLLLGLVFLLLWNTPLLAAPDHHALVQLYLDSPSDTEFLEANTQEPTDYESFKEAVA